MNRLTLALATLIALTLTATPALTGLEPSPFTPEINQLYAIDNQLQSIAKRVDDKLSLPPDDQTPGTVNATWAMEEKLIKLNDLQVLIMQDVLDVLQDPTLGMPPDDQLPPVIAALDTLIVSAAGITFAIDEYKADFGIPPDDQTPFIVALNAVFTATLNLSETSQLYSAILEEPCSLFLNPTDCNAIDGCGWNPSADPAGCFPGNNLGS